MATRVSPVSLAVLKPQELRRVREADLTRGCGCWKSAFQVPGSPRGRCTAESGSGLGEMEGGSDEGNRWRLERSSSCHSLLEQRGACHYLLVCLDLISIPLKGNAEILPGRIRPLQTFFIPLPPAASE